MKRIAGFSVGVMMAMVLLVACGKKTVDTNDADPPMERVMAEAMDSM